jgi:hypothetical protein
MGRHLAYTAVGKAIAAFVALAGLVAAMAAIALPTGHGPSPEVSAVLAVGALALLAGHAWGLLIVAAADLILVSSLWPMLVFESQKSTSTTTAAAIALIGALPGLIVFTRTLPGTVELVLGDGARRFRTHALTITGIAAFISLVFPVFGSGS